MSGLACAALCRAIPRSSHGQTIRGPSARALDPLPDLHFLVVLSRFWSNHSSAEVRDAGSSILRTRFSGQRHNVRIRRTAKINAEVVSRYQGGQSTRTIAAQLGMCKATVLQILKAQDVMIRPVGRHY